MCTPRDNLGVVVMIKILLCARTWTLAVQPAGVTTKSVIKYNFIHESWGLHNSAIYCTLWQLRQKFSYFLLTDTGLVTNQKKKPMAVPVQSWYLQCNVWILSNGVEKEGCVVVQWAKSCMLIQKAWYSSIKHAWHPSICRILINVSHVQVFLSDKTQQFWTH